MTLPDPKPIKMPLSASSPDTLNIIVKSIETQELVGSVSIPQWLVLEGGTGVHSQWVTLFESEIDDEFDGQMGLSDQEDPKVNL